MANIQEIRNLRSIALTSSLAPMASDLEQVLRCTDDPSFYATFRNQPQAVRKPAVTLEASLKSDDEGPPSSPTHRTTPALDVP